jgi:hypothetical protein
MESITSTLTTEYAAHELEPNGRTRTRDQWVDWVLGEANTNRDAASQYCIARRALEERGKPPEQITLDEMRDELSARWTQQNSEPDNVLELRRVTEKNLQDENPRFTYDRGIATVSWDSVTMHFDMLRLDNRTGAVTAEMTILTGADNRPLRRTVLNLVNGDTRAREAKYLRELMPDVDWTRRLETASWQVIDAFRQGRPAIYLRDAAADNCTWLVEPLINERDATIFFGDGGSAKSEFGLALALSIHTGQEIIRGFKPTRTLRTAFLDYEWEPEPHKRRMRRLLGTDVPDSQLPDLVYVPCGREGPLVHQIDRLRRIFHEHEIEYAVLDSVGVACDGPLAADDTVFRFFNALAQLETGSLLNAHIVKIESKEQTQYPFGSVFWHNSARMTWFVKATGDGGPTLDVAMVNRKYNDGPKQLKPIGLRYEFGETQTTVSRIDVKDIPAARDALSTKDRMIAELKSANTPLTFKALADLCDAKEDSIRKTVGRNPRLFVILDENPNRVALKTNREPA